MFESLAKARRRTVNMFKSTTQPIVNRFERTRVWLGYRIRLPTLPPVRPRLNRSLKALKRPWIYVVVRARRLVKRSPASGALVAILHARPLVWYAGPDTYVAVTVLRVSYGGSPRPAPGPVHISLVRRGLRTALFGWNPVGLAAAPTIDVTPVTEFGRAPLLRAPLSPVSSRSSILSPNPSPKRHKSALLNQLAARRSRKVSGSNSVASASSVTSEVSSANRTLISRHSQNYLHNDHLHLKTSFSSEMLSRFEIQSRSYAEQWSAKHVPASLAPVATHIVRIPASAGDGYFRLIITHPSATPSGDERHLGNDHVAEVTVTSPLVRVFSFCPPLGTPRGAPIWFPPLFLVELGLAIFGTLLAIGLSILVQLAPIVLKWTEDLIHTLGWYAGQPPSQPSPQQDGSSKEASRSASQTTLTLAAFGFRRPLLDQLDQGYGRGGVTYWR